MIATATMAAPASFRLPDYAVITRSSQGVAHAEPGVRAAVVQRLHADVRGPLARELGLAGTGDEHVARIACHELQVAERELQGLRCEFVGQPLVDRRIKRCPVDPGRGRTRAIGIELDL